MAGRLALLVTLVALACDDTSGVVPAGAPAAMVIVSGNTQSGTVGKELANPLVAKIVDSNGTPVQGQIVSFKVVSGGGSVFAGATLTNAAGIAQESWTLGTSVADSQRVEARAVDPNTGAKLVFGVFTATPVADQPTSVLRVGGDGQAAEPGAAMADSLVVLVRDKYNNPALGASVAWSVTAGGGSVSPATATADSLGRASTLFRAGPTGGPQLATASVADMAIMFTAGAYDHFTAVSLTPGEYKACGITSRGSFCWGANKFHDTAPACGSKAFGSYQICELPMPVNGSEPFENVGAGYTHACARAANGAAYCWGQNNYGEAGIGTFTDEATTPTAVTGGLAFVSISVGSGVSCGLTAAGAAYCWGVAALGSGDSVAVNSPRAVSGGYVFTSLSARGDHVCGLVATAAYCWGNGTYGQLGNGGFAASRTPVPVSGGLNFVSLSAGASHTCGIISSGAAYCWGANNNLALGVPSSTTQGNPVSGSPVPVAVLGGFSFSQISAGSVHTCALTSDGTAYCWGRSGGGALGDGTTNTRHLPAPVSTTLKFTAISAGYFSTCAVTAQGAAYCWGENFDGNLGTGTMTNALTPVRVQPSRY